MNLSQLKKLHTRIHRAYLEWFHDSAVAESCVDSDAVDERHSQNVERILKRFGEQAGCPSPVRVDDPVVYPPPEAYSSGYFPESWQASANASEEPQSTAEEPPEEEAWTLVNHLMRRLGSDVHWIREGDDFEFTLAGRSFRISTSLLESVDIAKLADGIASQTLPKPVKDEKGKPLVLSLGDTVRVEGRDAVVVTTAVEAFGGFAYSFSTDNPSPGIPRYELRTLDGSELSRQWWLAEDIDGLIKKAAK